MKRFSLALVVWAPLAVFGATETPPDPFGVAPCVVARVPPLGDDAKYVTKVLRPPYSLEFPFHAVLDETRVPLADHNAEHPGAKVSALFVGHGGYLLESGLPHQMAGTDFVLFVEIWLGRKAKFPPGCFFYQPTVEPMSRITLDPYAGNAFVARLEGTTLDLVVIDTRGAPVARIHVDLFSPTPLVDRTGAPYADLLEEGAGGFFWFDLGRLASFVDLYRRTGGEEYARFVADAFLADWMQSWTDDWPGAEGMRLPYLPSVAGDRPRGDPAAALRLDGLRTVPYWQFIPGKPRRGGIYAPLVPMLKLLEARDCVDQHDEQPLPGSCPSYSVMALQTEIHRKFPGRSDASGHALWEVFDVIRSRGVCREHLYPMPEGKALGWPETLDEFARRSEKALNRMLRHGDPEDPAVAALRESAGGRRVEFVNALPPPCAEEMRRYVEQQDLAGHDLVDLYAAQHEFGRSLPGSDSETLREGQQAELLHLTLRLLDDGAPVVVGGDGGVLDRRAALAYGRTEHGVVVMDGSVEDEASRRRTVISFEDLRETLWGIAFLRGGIAESDPTEAQLRTSLEHAPESLWAQYQLGRVLQRAGRHHEAVVALRRAVELDPEHPYVRKELGESLSEIARFDEAVEAFVKAIDLGLGDSSCHESLGFALRKLGRPEEATEAFRRALELDPDRPWAAQQLGWTFHDAGDDLEAETWFRKALDLRPDDLSYRRDFAAFLTCVGRGDEARVLLLAAAETVAEAETLTSIGIGLLNSGYPLEASTVLKRAMTMEPDDELRSRLSLARAYRLLGDTDGLSALLEPIEEKLGSLASAGTLDTDGWIDLAYARAMLGDPESCRASVDTLLHTRGEPDGGDLYDLACIHALNGDPDQAMDALERAFEVGYHSYHWVWHDPDLTDLAKDPRFEELLDRYAPHER